MAKLSDFIGAQGDVDTIEGFEGTSLAHAVGVFFSGDSGLERFNSQDIGVDTDTLQLSRLLQNGNHVIAVVMEQDLSGNDMAGAEARVGCYLITPDRQRFQRLWGDEIRGVFKQATEDGETQTDGYKIVYDFANNNELSHLDLFVEIVTYRLFESL